MTLMQPSLHKDYFTKFTLNEFVLNVTLDCGYLTLRGKLKGCFPTLVPYFDIVPPNHTTKVPGVNHH